MESDSDCDIYGRLNLNGRINGLDREELKKYIFEKHRFQGTNRETLIEVYYYDQNVLKKMIDKGSIDRSAIDFFAAQGLKLSRIKSTPTEGFGKISIEMLIDEFFDEKRNNKGISVYNGTNGNTKGEEILKSDISRSRAITKSNKCGCPQNNNLKYIGKKLFRSEQYVLKTYCCTKCGRQYDFKEKLSDIDVVKDVEIKNQDKICNEEEMPIIESKDKGRIIARTEPIEKVVYDTNKGKVYQNSRYNSIEISFNNKPDNSVIEALKTYRWKWNRTKWRWYNKNNLDNLVFAHDLIYGYGNKTEQSEKKEIDIKNAYKDNRKKTVNVLTGDFLVRKQLYFCVHNKHNYEDVNGIISIINEQGEKIEMVFPVTICDTCKKFYIREQDYQSILRYGVPLCKIIKEEKLYKSEFNEFNLSDQSILNMLGYRVSRDSGMSMAQRQAILKYIIEDGVLTRTQVLNHIEFLIRLNRNKYDFESAIFKWKEDREFVADLIMKRTVRFT